MPQPTSTISSNIESYASDIYLNPALVQNNRVEDLMDICALEQLLQIAKLTHATHPILEMGYGTGSCCANSPSAMACTSISSKALPPSAKKPIKFMALA